MSRLPIPAPLKRVLVPVWNESHRFGWIVRDHLAAIASGSREHCSVCGRNSLMLYRRRIIPAKLAELWGLTPRLAESLAKKESCHCASCGAPLRARRLAEVLLKLYLTSSEPCLSIRDWVRDPTIRAMKIAEINRVDGLHEQLARLPNLAFSDFSPGAKPGETVNGIRSEDLTRLTYADESFDLVITSESLEHVPDLNKALAEIRRVLKPGGCHIFTIPQIPGVAKTYPRAVLREDSSVEHLASPICHPGGDVGYPVFTEFGADLPDLLREAGFEVEVFFGPNREDDLAQVYVARRSS